MPWDAAHSSYTLRVSQNIRPLHMLPTPYRGRGHSENEFWNVDAFVGHGSACLRTTYTTAAHYLRALKRKIQDSVSRIITISNTCVFCRVERVAECLQSMSLGGLVQQQMTLCPTPCFACWLFSLAVDRSDTGCCFSGTCRYDTHDAGATLRLAHSKTEEPTPVSWARLCSGDTHTQSTHEAAPSGLSVKASPPPGWAQTEGLSGMRSLDCPGKHVTHIWKAFKVQPLGSRLSAERADQKTRMWGRRQGEQGVSDQHFPSICIQGWSAS